MIETTAPDLTRMPALIPRRVLFDNPDGALPQISPDGRRIGFAAPVDGVLNILVGEIDAPLESYRPVTRDRGRGVRTWLWAPDSERVIYLQDAGGDENWLLHVVDLESEEDTLVTPFERAQVRILHYDVDRPDLVLLGINNREPAFHDIYAWNPQNGDLRLVEETTGFVGLGFDAEFNWRLGSKYNPDGRVDHYIRDKGSDEWRLLFSVDAEDAGSAPVGFYRDGSALLLRSSVGANASRLLRYDLATGKQTVLLEDPEYDAVEVLKNRDTWAPTLAAIWRDRRELVVLDPDIAADVEAASRVDEGELSIASRDRAERYWLLAFTADASPGSYWIFDRPTGKARKLFDVRPDLAGYELAPMEPFSFTARDGLLVHGYATFPPGLDRKGLPTVLYVHGGPWARDFWGFNPNAQWFANRGYLCLQVNYRGSTGYGKKFLHAADREWAGKMHDDLIDACDHAVAEGWADRSRIAIYGGSYGGYAALVGATFTPDYFRCAVDICGPSSLITLIKSFPDYWKPTIAMWHLRLGNPDTEPDFVLSRSPISRVDDIRVPLLIGQGANDPRVTVVESEQIVKAMRERGIPVEYVLFEDEGHGFAKPENRLAFNERAEAFLAECLGGRLEN